MDNKLAKVLVWRVLSFIVSSLITWIYLGEFVRSLILSLILVVVMTSLHFVFEVLWERHNKFNYWHRQ